MTLKGVAFDVGTTTVVGSSVDLERGVVGGTLTHQNPQIEFGGDILTRIRALADDPSLLGEMQKRVVDTCNEIIGGLLGEAEPAVIAAAGNSVMTHILLGVSPAPLSKVPYRPAFKDGRVTGALELGLRGAKGAVLYTFPLIGGFVGGDTVSVILALGLHGRKDTTLTVDIGTNSESVLVHDGVIYTAAAPAGPAFEGGEIRHGMIAGPGAIERVTLEGDRCKVGVIGGGTPLGLCGSGLLDGVAVLLEAGVIDSSGRIVDSDEVESNLGLKVKEDGEGNHFILSKTARGEVVLCQADIRALQMAKSAIRSGITMLLKKAKIAPEDIDEVFIAGTFGSHLDLGGLNTIGILEECWLDKVSSVGGAALDGAVLAAISEDRRLEAEAIAREAKYISLSGSKHFEREFIEQMNF